MTSPFTYLGIANDLQRGITEGRYPPGSAIPSYSELARIYQASVSKVQRAIDLLRDRGAVVGYQGRGVFVVDGPTSSGRMERQLMRSRLG